MYDIDYKDLINEIDNMSVQEYDEAHKEAKKMKMAEIINYIKARGQLMSIEDCDCAIRVTDISNKLPIIIYKNNTYAIITDIMTFDAVINKNYQLIDSIYMIEKYYLRVLFEELLY